MAASEADRHKQILKQTVGEEAETDTARDSVEARAEAAHARQERDFQERRAQPEQARENHQEVRALRLPAARANLRPTPAPPRRAARARAGQAVEEAHESYEEARARAVEAKDALRSALTDRDALTEVLRSSPYTTKAAADAQLKNVQDKVGARRPCVPPAIADVSRSAFAPPPSRARGLTPLAALSLSLGFHSSSYALPPLALLLLTSFSPFPPPHSLSPLSLPPPLPLVVRKWPIR